LSYDTVTVPWKDHSKGMQLSSDYIISSTSMLTVIYQPNLRLSAHARPSSHTSARRQLPRTSDSGF